MRYLIFLLGLALLLLSGCVIQQSPQQHNHNARYFQIHHMINDAVGVQMALPKAKACKQMLAIIKNEIDSPEIEMVSCSPISSSASLPYHAVVKNQEYGFVLEVEAISERLCQSAIRNMTSLELISECKEKRNLTR